MSFCSFTKEAVKNAMTDVDNYYITEFLPEANGDAVKVYLYGLYLCKNFEGEFTVSDFARNMFMDESLVMDLFKYWEDFDVVSIISESPFTVKYLPLTNLGKPRKYKSGKYDDFSKAVQLLITDRMISVNEYSNYFSVMEDFNVSQEAMLMIIKYYVDRKGAAVSGNFIVSEVKKLAFRGITTASAVEAELADYTNSSDEVQKVLSAMGLKHKPEIDDFNFFNKWTKDMNFSCKTVVFVAKAKKAKSSAYLDKIMTELYNAKKFTEKDITEYFAEKEKINDLTRSILRELSVYVEVVAPVIENYVNPWLALGFDGDTLTFIANYCFKRRKRSLEGMDDTVKSLYQKGLVTLYAIGDYLKNRAKEDEFIKKILSVTATDRLANDWDRQTVAIWREWGFDDEMILKCATFAGGKTNPLVYMNTILSNWKARGITTVEQIPTVATASDTGAVSQHTANERKYTKEQLDKLLTDIEDVDF